MRLPRSVYVHVPFCRHRCGYCNFTLVANRDDWVERYLNAIEVEILGVDFGEEEAVEIDTLFLGGGTPTHLSPQQLERLIKVIGNKFSFSKGVEFSIEANPKDVTHEKVALLSSLGVNRFSLGVQSFNKRKLQMLERDHDAEVVHEAIRTIRDRVADISIDLIIGSPGESVDDWHKDLESALSVEPTHISTYSLTIEKGTQFWNRWNRGDLNEVSEDASASWYEYGIDFLKENGFEHYEVSNFSRPGFRCKHNENYWFGNSYFGFGPGAARYVDGKRELNHRSTSRYLQLVQAGQSPTVESELIDAEGSAREKLIFGLRRIEGVDSQAFQMETGFAVTDLVERELNRLLDQELLESEGNTFRLTRAGLLVSDSIWPLLI